MVLVEPNSNQEFESAFNGAKSMVFFTAVWSSPSRLMEGEITLLVTQYSSITFIKVDIDRLNTLPNVKEIKSIPAFKTYNRKSLVREFFGPDPNTVKEMAAQLNKL